MESSNQPEGQAPMDYEEIAETQGWNNDSMIGIMAEFIYHAGLRDQFTEFCEAKANEENEGASL